MHKLFLFIFSAVTFISCEKEPFFLWEEKMGIEEDSTYLYTASPVFEVIAPSNVEFGEKIKIQVRSHGNSGCALFSHFRESRSGQNTLNVQVLQKKPPENYYCTTALTKLAGTYEIIPEARGKYTFNFWRGELHENDFITIQVSVR